MDPEDDMHDANDAESMDDDYYSGDAEDYYNSDTADVDDFEFIEDADDDSDIFAARRHQVSGFCPGFLFLRSANCGVELCERGSEVFLDCWRW